MKIKDKKKSRKAYINKDDCLGCRNCFLNCRKKVIGHKKSFFGGYCYVNQDKCVGCGNCLKMCLNDCIKISQVS